MKVDAASRRVQFTDSGDVFHAAGRRVYSKALFSKQEIARDQPLTGGMHARNRPDDFAL